MHQPRTLRRYRRAAHAAAGCCGRIAMSVRAIRGHDQGVSGGALGWRRTRQTWQEQGWRCVAACRDRRRHSSLSRVSLLWCRQLRIERRMLDRHLHQLRVTIQHVVCDPSRPGRKVSPSGESTGTSIGYVSASSSATASAEPDSRSASSVEPGGLSTARLTWRGASPSTTAGIGSVSGPSSSEPPHGSSLATDSGLASTGAVSGSPGRGAAELTGGASVGAGGFSL